MDMLFERPAVLNDKGRVEAARKARKVLEGEGVAFVADPDRPDAYLARFAGFEAAVSYDPETGTFEVDVDTGLMIEPGREAVTWARARVLNGFRYKFCDLFGVAPGERYHGGFSWEAGQVVHIVMRSPAGCLETRLLVGVPCVAAKKVVEFLAPAASGSEGFLDSDGRSDRDGDTADLGERLRRLLADL